MVNINADEAIAKLQKNLSKLSEKQIASAMAGAMNRALETGVTAGKKYIKQNYNIPKEDIDAALRIKNVSTKLLTGSIDSSSKSIGLSHFQPTFSFNKRSTTGHWKSEDNRKGAQSTRIHKKGTFSKYFGKGVQVEIIKGNKVTIPYAFMIAGKTPVFARGKYENSGAFAFLQRHKRASATGRDSPISSLVNVSVYSSLVNEKVMPSVRAKVEANLSARLIHELDKRIEKIIP